MVAQDLALAKSVSGGDHDAFNVIYATYQKSVYHHVLRMIHDRFEAEDLTQEVFLKAYQFMDTYSGTAVLGRWLKKIATNLCIDRMRKRSLPMAAWPVAVSKDGDEQQVEFSDDGPSPLDMTESKEYMESIGQAISELPEHYRNVVVLRDVMDCSGDQTALQLACPTGTVKSRLSRGHEMLRERFLPALGIVS